MIDRADEAIEGVFPMPRSVRWPYRRIAPTPGRGGAAGPSRVQASYINALDGTTPNAGIHLDAASSDNGIFTNNISGYNTDVLDDGTNNCWRRNTFITGSIPSSGCM